MESKGTVRVVLGGQSAFDYAGRGMWRNLEERVSRKWRYFSHPDRRCPLELQELQNVSRWSPSSRTGIRNDIKIKYT